MISSCTTLKKSHAKQLEENVTVGQLDEEKYNEIKKILTEKSPQALNDTIIIRYDYNNNECWRALDQENDNYIKSMILRHNQIISNKSASRPNISVFNFREPGDDFSKKVLWDKTYIVDSSNQLFNLIFNKRIMCGNSVIILPDMRFVFVPSDPHFDALNFTSEEISSFLRKK